MTSRDGGARPSIEAQEALETARLARADNEAILPLTERMARRMRDSVTVEEFIDLITATMEHAVPGGH